METTEQNLLIRTLLNKAKIEPPDGEFRVVLSEINGNKR